MDVRIVEKLECALVTVIGAKMVVGHAWFYTAVGHGHDCFGRRWNMSLVLDVM